MNYIKNLVSKRTKSAYQGAFNSKLNQSVLKLKQSTLGKKYVEDESGVEIQEDGQLGFFIAQKTLSHYTVPIDSAFTEPAYYRTVVQMLINATEYDEVAFLINSPGGSLSGLLTLLEGINMTEAGTTAVIVGEASSAASMFALSCDNILVSENATMLCHNISYGTSGKGSDVLAMVQHTTTIANKLLRKVYRHFLSEEEILEVMSGKEIYLEQEDIVARLDYRQEQLAFEEEEDLKQQEQALIEQEQAIIADLIEKHNKSLKQSTDSVKPSSKVKKVPTRVQKQAPKVKEE